ncbi:MAG: HDIG domain-containing protein [Thermodesulfobacteriota bacterium]|jgi:putative nucleotidyltransferase with HDIG domain|nr:MAG: HDIG domain-containing protein [Thermodesulfobacteriota bacterium]
MINREKSLTLLKGHIQAENLIKHCLATEAIMRKVAQRLGKEVELCGLTGLLHDIDLEITRDDQSKHALVGADLLEKEGFPQEALQAIRAHNGERLGIERQTEFEHALAASETITGLIVATALVQPEKKIANVKIKSVTKRMKEKRFAENVNRDIIKECELFGIPVEDFVALSITAMQGIADDLGL